ncbi:MAG: hypothetical protein DRP74_07835 [Candidatus Omnitrophota bacterium]|nr:MAG: hypothetical protein DRP74_07835 [Candidatus Omnitrophota bacterium]
MLTLENIMNLYWDILIVLDACRYDYFAKANQDFFKGILRKGLSQLLKLQTELKLYLEDMMT